MTMNKMYSSKDVETEQPTTLTETSANDKRIKQLEDRVRHLTEQVHKMASMIELNTKQIRKHNTNTQNS